MANARGPRTLAPVESGPDPLADVRGLMDQGPASMTGVAETGPLGREAMAVRLIERYHADQTIERFVHKGGACPCRYIAEASLAVLGLDDA
jgi:hypothetical protein